MTQSPPRVLVTRPLIGAWREVLAGIGAVVDVADDRPMPRDEQLARAAGCAGVLSMLTERWDAEAMDAAGPALRVIANYAVGYNNIDVAAATARGIVVTNTPDVLTAATADTAWALLLAAARRVGESERSLRRGEFHGWGPNDWHGVDLEGRTLGIIGAGRIGTAIARRSRGWDMRVVYHHHQPKPAFEAATGAERLPLDELLATADFVSLSTPLTPATRHMIGARELALMKPTAVLVNTGRGPVVDEAALVEALRNRRIFAAGLDVYEQEPQLAAGLADLENAVLLPHIGSATTATRARMAEIAASNIAAVLTGHPAPQRVG